MCFGRGLKTLSHESDENIKLDFVTFVFVTVAVTHSLSGCEACHAPSCHSSNFVWQLNMIRSSL